MIGKTIGQLQTSWNQLREVWRGLRPLPDIEHFLELASWQNRFYGKREVIKSLAMSMDQEQRVSIGLVKSPTGKLLVNYMAVGDHYIVHVQWTCRLGNKRRDLNCLKDTLNS